MPRPHRIEFDGAWYHILNRGARRHQIFHDDQDHLSFLSLLADVRKIWNVQTHAYSLMKNHYHLMIHTPDSHLSLSMKHLHSLYALYYNKKYKKDGPLFRGRFKSILAEKDTYLLDLVRYIHNNPVKANICINPEDHRWSSHQGYLDSKKKPKWLVTAEVLAEFGKTYQQAKVGFDKFVKSGVHADLIKVLESKKQISVLGSIGFRDWVKDNLLDKIKKETLLPTARHSKRIIVKPAKIFKFVSQQYLIPLKSVTESQRGKQNEARSMAIYLLRHVNGMTHTEIAQALKTNSSLAISQTLYRFLKKIQNDKVIQAKANSYLSNLIGNSPS